MLFDDIHVTIVGDDDGGWLWNWRDWPDDTRARLLRGGVIRLPLGQSSPQSIEVPRRRAAPWVFTVTDGGK